MGRELASTPEVWQWKAGAGAWLPSTQAQILSRGQGWVAIANGCANLPKPAQK